MGKRDGFWDSVPDVGDGQIAWPQDPSGRASLVQDVFAARVVGAMDAIVETSLEIASGKRPEPGSHEYEKQAAFRNVFLGMTDQQREAVRKLVCDTASGTLRRAPCIGFSPSSTTSRAVRSGCVLSLGDQAASRYRSAVSTSIRNCTTCTSIGSSDSAITSRCPRVMSVGSGATGLPNKGMKQTKPAQALELRSLSLVFGGPASHPSERDERRIVRGRPASAIRAKRRLPDGP
jgi:hypothetical protein